MWATKCSTLLYKRTMTVHWPIFVQTSYGCSSQSSSAAAVNQVLVENIVLIGPRKDVV